MKDRKVGNAEFRQVQADTGFVSLELSIVEVDFIRYAICVQEQEALGTNEPTVAGMIADLSGRLLDLFSPVAWAEYHTAIEMADDDE